MRTYSLVCLASAALTVIVGYPELWFGGHGQVPSNPDVTRVIQGIVTGVGFLGAGVIIKEGFTISGLTTAASIWTASAIGVLVGVGFYAAAISLAVMSALVMMWVSKLEMWLPSRHAIAIELHFTLGFAPTEDGLNRALKDIGYEMATGSLVIDSNSGKQRWHFAAIALLKSNHYSIPVISNHLSALNGVEDYRLAFARN
jgi:putative Mg2+ transporter-C (MgtC) family protein